MVGLLLGLAGHCKANTFTYSLANDWSDTSNPNGVWSYNEAPGVPIPVHQSHYFPGTVAQPAWANEPLPQVGHIPVWLKAVYDYSSDPTANLDLPLGRVGMHPNDPFNSPPGLANAVAGLGWTSPFAGTAAISGDLWELSRSLGRSIDWNITLNGLPLTGGTIFSTDPYTSSNPDSFANGFGGTGALTFAVARGDVVSLNIVRHLPNEAGTFTGVDETIMLQTAVPEPSSLAIGGIGALALLWYLWHRTRDTV
jgi:hypothetical protein